MTRCQASELVALYLESRKGKIHSTSFAVETNWLTDFHKLYGSRQAADVSRLEAQKYIGGIMVRSYTKAGKTIVYRPKTVNRALCTFKQCWKWAIETDLLANRNPFHKLPLLPTEGRQRVMTEAEFQALLRCSHPSFRGG